MPSQPTTEASGDSLLQAMSDAILAIASEPRLDPVLQKLVESAQHLVDARYAALGVPDEDGESLGVLLGIWGESFWWGRLSTDFTS